MESITFLPEGKECHITPVTHGLVVSLPDPTSTGESNQEIPKYVPPEEIPISPEESVDVVIIPKDTQNCDEPMDSCDAIAKQGGNVDITCKTSSNVPETIQIENYNKTICTEKDTVSVPDTRSKDKMCVRNQSYFCSCGELFSKSTDLAAHKRWTCKMSEKKCQCEVCDGWFAHEQGLKRHMKQAHGGIFPCDSCGLRFHNKRKLTRHWMEAHYDDKCTEKKLKCFICDKDQFGGRYEFECHLLAHKYKAKEITATPSSNEGMSRASSSSTQTSTAWEPSQHIGDPSTYPPSAPGHLEHHMHDRFSHRFPHFNSFGVFPGHSILGQPATGVMGADYGCRMPTFFPSPPPPPPPPSQPDGLPPAPPPPPQPPPPPPLAHHWAAAHPQGPTHPPYRWYSPLPPHHNHNPPPYTGHGMKHCGYHSNRRKWKHHYKTMMSEMPAFQFARPGSGGRCVRSATDEPHVPIENNWDGMVTCEHCGETVHSKYIFSHKRRGCRVLCVHRCAVCGMAFASKRILFRHMYKQGHMNPGVVDANALQGEGEGESSSVSRLREKLKYVLNFKNSNRSNPLASPSPVPDPISGNCSQHVLGSKTCNAQHAKVNDCRNLQPVNGIITADNTVESQSEKSLIIVEDCSEDCSKIWKCCVCQYILQSKNDLYTHLEDHLSHVKSVLKVREWKRKSAKYFLDKDLTNEVNSITSFATPVDLSSSSLPFQCDSSSNITSHPSTISTAVSESDKWMKPHGKHKHSKQQIFPCEVCSEKFTFRRDLVHHMKDKHNDYTLECPQCHKTFSWKNRAKFYNRHLMSHRGVSVFNHKCKVCDKTFLESHKLQAHMAKHKADLLHTCITCGKGYGNKSSLLRHQRKHTGDKPHQCEVCNETFWEKRELVRHTASHTGSAPFVCSDCGHGFTLKTSLMKHLKRKHGKSFIGQDSPDSMKL